MALIADWKRVCFSISNEIEQRAWRSWSENFGFASSDFLSVAAKFTDRAAAITLACVLPRKARLATRASGGLCSAFLGFEVLDGEVGGDCVVVVDGFSGGVARQAEARLAAHNHALDRSLRVIVSRSFCFGAIRGTMEIRG